MILLGLGANLPSPAGAPVETLRFALGKLATLGIVPLRTSNFFAAAAWPDPADPEFVNAVAQVETVLDPATLLNELHAIEEQMGRRRGARNAPRILDLDLLDYHGRVDTGPPELPHPRMVERGFVLIPLSELAPNWRHPTTNRTVDALISALPPDQRQIRRLILE